MVKKYKKEIKIKCREMWIEKLVLDKTSLKICNLINKRIRWEIVKEINKLDMNKIMNLIIDRYNSRTSISNKCIFCDVNMTSHDIIHIIMNCNLFIGLSKYKDINSKLIGIVKKYHSLINSLTK